MRAGKALTSLFICTGSLESSLLDNAMSTKSNVLLFFFCFFFSSEICHAAMQCNATRGVISGSTLFANTHGSNGLTCVFCTVPDRCTHVSQNG